MTEKQFNTDYISLSATLYRVAFYILESEAEAEDAVQELYLRLWAKRDSLNDVQSPKAYCIRVLRNLCLDRIRSAKHLDYTEQLPDLETPGNQDEDIDAGMRLEDVLEAVKSLPERQRTVLILRTVEGLSYEEITTLTGINYLTLRVLLSQARHRLKAKL